MSKPSRSPWSYVLPLAVALGLGAVVAYFAVTSIMAYQARVAPEQLEQEAKAALAASKESARKRREEQMLKKKPPPVTSPPVADKRPAYPTGSADMPNGSKACMYGYVNIKDGDRWRQWNRAGKAVPCRVARR
ncbi:MAG: hypothetical protein R3F22_04505 [Lysobacteraceae bacterium]